MIELRRLLSPFFLKAKICTPGFVRRTTEAILLAEGRAATTKPACIADLSLLGVVHGSSLLSPVSFL